MIRQTCSWCHASNVLDTIPTFCTCCGHRADVCRLDCTCGRCRPAASDRYPSLASALVADRHGQEGFLDLDLLDALDKADAAAEMALEGTGKAS